MSATLPQPSQAGLDSARRAIPFRSPSIIAYIIDLFLLGMVTANAVYYFWRGSRDPTIVKVLIAFCVGVLWCKSCLNIKSLWGSVLFLAYRDLPPEMPWSMLTSIVIGQIPMTLSQTYLCYRLWSISQKKMLPNAIAVAGTLLSTILFIIYAVLRVKYPIPGGSQDRSQPWVPPWAFCTCVTDIYLSVTFSMFLLRTRKNAVGDRLDYMLLRLASLSITTCLPPALISAIMAILEITKSTGDAWTFFVAILASVYALCILHSLNSRQEILEKARSRSTMKKPSPTPGPNRVISPGQSLTQSSVIAITQVHSPKSGPRGAPLPLSFPMNLLDAMSSFKRPSLEAAPFSIHSENHRLRSLHVQITKSQDESQTEICAGATGIKYQVQVTTRIEGWNGAN